MRSVIISMQQGHMRGVLPPSVSIETCINWCLWAHNSSLFCKWPCPCHIGHAAAATWISADLKCPYWLFEARILHCFLWELLYGLRLELLWTLFLYSVRADRGCSSALPVPQLDFKSSIFSGKVYSVSLLCTTWFSNYSFLELESLDSQ